MNRILCFFSTWVEIRYLHTKFSRLQELVMCITKAVESSKPMNATNIVFSISTHTILTDSQLYPIRSFFEFFYCTKSKNTCSCRYSKWEKKKQLQPHHRDNQLTFQIRSFQNIDIYTQRETEREKQSFKKTFQWEDTSDTDPDGAGSVGAR